MNWKQYVALHLNGNTQAAIADMAGVSQTAVSRWLKGTQGVDAAVAIRFAKAVGDDPLTALVAGGYLTPSEAKMRPASAPDYSQLTNDELLELVRKRMGEDDGTATNQAGGDPAPTPIGSRRRGVSKPATNAARKRDKRTD